MGLSNFGIFFLYIKLHKVITFKPNKSFDHLTHIKKKIYINKRKIVLLINYLY